MDRVKGIIGGIIGGLIAAIPWVLVYVYGGWLLSLLAMIIAYGVIFGYRKLNGPIDEKLPWIVGIISVVIVIFVTLVAIPLLQLGNEGYIVSINSLFKLYSLSEFRSSIIWDLVISLAFTAIGISGVIATIKKQLTQE